ncbi:DUF397 domain-containing protein [Sphaerisporangium rhizosphaerae]|uniref:DUF397 domain-containing protein n=1 Tax=Sphaerisporangium rhizosphaerae TaxID=2269375 RepID=A0ABW2PAY2_9ACTN
MPGGRRLKGIWRKSSRSGAQSNCVEARFDGGTVWVRNSNDAGPGRVVVGFGAEGWPAFLEVVRAGELGLDRLGGDARSVGEATVLRDVRGVVVQGRGYGPPVVYTAAEWQAFLDGVRHDGEFTLTWLSEPATA